MKTALKNRDGMIATTAIPVMSQIATFKGQDYQVKGTSEVLLAVLPTREGNVKLLLSTGLMSDGQTMVQEVTLTLSDVDWLANQFADWVEGDTFPKGGEALQ